MSATISHQSAAAIQLRSFCNRTGSNHRCQSSSLGFISRSSMVDIGLQRKVTCASNQSKLHFLRASVSYASVRDPITTCGESSADNSQNASLEAALILIRHGESMWNEKNLFTGSVDVPLTKKGMKEAIDAGKKICNIPVDIIYTSSLIRAQMTAMLAMTQHRHKKEVTTMIHRCQSLHIMRMNKAKAWDQIFSEETKKQSIPVITAWQLNERMYGELQGLNKQETVERYGKEKVHEWRRSYDIPPPNGESLEMCSERAVSYFREQIEPQLQVGKHVLVAAHGNSLRSIIMYLDELTPQEVISLELSTGVPLLYIYKDEKFVKRGSPVGPTEDGVYAYTKSLAGYRQKLDESLTEL